MFKKLRAYGKRFVKDESGSETIEMVYGMMAICAMIITAVFILSYSLQANALMYAGKRITRSVEVSGKTLSTIESDKILGEFLPNKDEIGARLTFEKVDDWYDTRSDIHYIQLGDKFKTVVTGTYKVNLANPGDVSPIAIEVPMVSVVEGQSEIWWRRASDGTLQ